MHACRQGAVSQPEVIWVSVTVSFLLRHLVQLLSGASLLEAYEQARCTLAGGGLEGRQCQSEGRSSAGCRVVADRGRDRRCGGSAIVVCFVDGH